MSAPVWLITGTSSGFGKEIAFEALRRGHKVIATARSASKLGALKSAGAEVLSLDVTHELDELKKVTAEAHSKYGRLDILVNSAGYTLEAAVEEASPQETYDQFNTNVFGMLNLTRTVLPYMRSQRSGVIANFGSLGSWGGAPAFGLYCATKWACSGISETPQQELAPFGINVCSIEPGYFRSSFLNPGVRVSSKQTIQDYEDTVAGQYKKVLAQVDDNQPGDVQKGAKVIVDVLTKTGVAEGKEIPVRLVLGSNCQESIRKKVSDTLALLDEWKEISYSTDYPKNS